MGIVCVVYQQDFQFYQGKKLIGQFDQGKKLIGQFDQGKKLIGQFDQGKKLIGQLFTKRHFTMLWQITPSVICSVFL